MILLFKAIIESLSVLRGLSRSNLLKQILYQMIISECICHRECSFFVWKQAVKMCLRAGVQISAVQVIFTVTK